MSRLPGALAAVLATGFLFAGPTFADDKPDCHGQNQEQCRPDPQPDRGKDCQPHGKPGEMSDDHCGPTPTTVAVTPTTLAATTTTVAATTSGTVTTRPAGQLPSVSVLGVQESRRQQAPRQRQLATTGTPVGFLTALAFLAVTFGLALRYVTRLEKASGG